ncbi:hypothetical protein JMJ55_15705 [Belnapia sp. T6]|uniref:Uncharacterized protein n=1 Tax=Belnapia mucosa TaxID=2804532 RepID=A0ABS1V514_9PROT|nr:hypothetical protein [Belnapia mucosa]MBL6456782.1 hypothetical protein [Belnapia mucosa]
MRVRAGGWVATVLVLAGCGSVQSSGILAMGDGTHRITVTGRDLGEATRKALADASGFCTAQGAEAQLVQRQIDRAAYDLMFRCVPGGAGRFASGARGSGPIISSQAFKPGGRPMVPTAEAPPARIGGLPAQPPTLAALAALPGPSPMETPRSPVLPPAATLPPMAPVRAPETGPVFAPLSQAALAPVPEPLRGPVPRSYESLPPVTGQPGGPPQRPLIPLAPVADSASSVPPAGFWQVRRN